MKSFEEIIAEKKDGDMQIIAKAARCSERTVKAVIYSERKDYKKIQLLFTRLLNERKKLEENLASK